MAMTFDGLDKPNLILEDKINKGDTPFKGILFNGDESYQSVLASKRYKTVVDNVRYYNYFDRPLHKSLGDISIKMANAFMDVNRMESLHHKKLEKLAVDLVCKELCIPKGFIDFDAKIVPLNQLSNNEFNKNKSEDIKIDEQLINKIDFDVERKKRRLINSMIQGAAIRGHYMYHLVDVELEKISGTKDLISAYNVMMSVNDTFFWQIDDMTMENSVMNSNPVGISEVDFPEDYDNDVNVNPRIIARAINFPVLIHELIKGIMELFSYHGQSDNKLLVENVLKVEDTLSKELWDLRLGGSIWDMFKEQLPEEILIDDDKIELQNHLLVYIFKLPPNEFLHLFEDIITNKAKYKLEDMVNQIKYILATKEYEDSMRNYGMWDDD